MTQHYAQGRAHLTVGQEGCEEVADGPLHWAPEERGPRQPHEAASEQIDQIDLAGRVNGDTGCVESSNLELVRSIAAEWERGCYSSVEWADPEIEFVIADGPEPGRSTGRTGLAPRLLEFQNAWEEYHSEAVEYRELDDERVLVLTFASGRARASRVRIGQLRANVFHLRDGRVTRLVAYWDRERAFADLGLAPESGAA